MTFLSFRRPASRGALFACALAAPALAQPAPAVPALPAEGPPLPLAPFVISATRTLAPADRTGASVSVLDAAALAARQPEDVAAALRELPGLYLAANGAPGSATGVFLRGAATRQTVVTLDGRRLPPGLAGFFDLGLLPLDGIERVELLRGPASSLHGGNALGGVVNLVTTAARGGPPRGSVGVEAGSFSTFRADASAAGGSGAIDARAAASWLQTDNDRPNQDFTRRSLVAGAGVQIAPGARFDLLGTWLDAEAGLPNTRLVNDRVARSESRLWSLAPTLVLGQGGSWENTVSYARSEQRLETRGFAGGFPTPAGRSSGVNGRTDVTADQLEWQGDWRAAPEWLVTTGATWLRTTGTRFNDGTGSVPFGFTVPGRDIDRSDRSTAGFAQVQWEPAAGIQLVASARHEATRAFGDATTWRAAAAWRVPGARTLLRASAATAFSPPSVQDVVPATFGNPALRPERVRGGDAGFEQPLGRDGAWTIGATVFENRFRDLFAFDSATFSLQNIGRARARGVEAALAWQPAAGPVGLRLDYTYTDAQDEVARAPLVRRPRHLGAATVIWRPAPAWTVTAQARWVADRFDFDPATFARTRQPDFLTVRLALRWQASDALQLTARGENLTGRRYEEVAGYPALPRAVYGGVRWRW